jgi:hypothetical protein
MNTPSDIRIAARRPFAAALICAAAIITALVAIDAAAAQGRLTTSARSSSFVETAAMVESERKPYQAFLYPADCVANSNICRLTSDAVTVRRRLEIHQLACQGVHSGDLLPTISGVIDLETAAGAFVTRINLLDGRYIRNPGSTLSAWTISQPTLMFVPANHRIKITISSGSPTNQSSGCTISGYMVTLERTS